MGLNFEVIYDQQRYLVNDENLNTLNNLFDPPVVKLLKDVKTLSEDEFYPYRNALQTHLNPAVARSFMPSNDNLTIANKALTFENDILDRFQTIPKKIKSYKYLQVELETAKETKNLALVVSILRVALCIGIIAALALGTFFVWSAGIILSPAVLAIMAVVSAFVLIGLLIGAFTGTHQKRNFFQQMAAGFKGTKPLEKQIAKTTDDLRLSIEHTIPFFKQIDNATGKSNYETLLEKLNAIRIFYQNNQGLCLHESEFARGLFNAYPGMVAIKQKADEDNQKAITLITKTIEHLRQYEEFLNTVWSARIGVDEDEGLIID